MVTRITEHEKLVPLDSGESSEESLRTALALRSVTLVPLGEVDDDGKFVRGLSQFPTTAAEVHIVGTDAIGVMFNEFQSKGYDVGTLPSNDSQHIYFNPTPLFGRHFVVLGQTGAGKSHTVSVIKTNGTVERVS